MSLKTEQNRNVKQQQIIPNNLPKQRMIVKSVPERPHCDLSLAKPCWSLRPEESDGKLVRLAFSSGQLHDVAAAESALDFLFLVP